MPDDINPSALRATTGATAEQVAEAIGVHPNSIYALEKRAASPRAATVAKLADYFRLSDEKAGQLLRWFR